MVVPNFNASEPSSPIAPIGLPPAQGPTPASGQPPKQPYPTPGSPTQYPANPNVQNPQQPYGQVPQSNYGQAAPLNPNSTPPENPNWQQGPSGYPPHYDPAASYNNTPMVLGIISLVIAFFSCCCGLLIPVSLGLGITAWVLGHRDLKSIRAGRLPQSVHGTALAGMICGIIGASLSLLGIIAQVINLLIAVMG